MKRQSGMPIILFCLALSHAAVAVPVPQEESGKSKKSDPTKTEGKEAERTKTAKPDSQSTITIRVKVSAEGMSVLPEGSTIELKGDDEACKKETRAEQNLEPDEVTFRDLPVCRVKFRIFITSFEVKTVSVDLANYKKPMKILIKANGPPVVTW